MASRFIVAAMSPQYAPRDDGRMGGISSDDDQVCAEVLYADWRVGYVDRETDETEEQSGK